MARVQVREPIPDDEINASQAPAALEPTPQPAETAPPAPSYQARKPRNLVTKANLLIGVTVIVLVLVVITLISLLNDRKELKQEVNKLSTTQTTSTANDAQKYQDAVGKLVDVPIGVTPAVSVLTQDSLKQLPQDSILQTSAKAGDVILLYKTTEPNSFVVMYRPSSNKVIIATGSTTGNSSPATKPKQ